MNELTDAVFGPCSPSRACAVDVGRCREERRRDGQRLRIGARCHVDGGGAREALRT